jgi:hypothetical protein
MPRGFAWAYYESDDGVTYALRVDQDYVEMPERGWTAPAVAGTPVYPRGWVPRKVVGLDEAGHPREALVGTVTCDLWTGAATTFVINATDELPHTCTVTGRRSERLSQRPT